MTQRGEALFRPVLRSKRGRSRLDHHAQAEQVAQQLLVRLALEQPVEDVEVQQVPAIARHHGGADLGPALHQPLCRQRSNGFPIGAARDIEADAGRFLVVEHGSRRQFAGEDGGADLLGGAVVRPLQTPAFVDHSHVPSSWLGTEIAPRRMVATPQCPAPDQYSE